MFRSFFKKAKVSTFPAFHFSSIPSKIKEKVPISHIRNFCIIAHIDHGKSTLADRLLEITGTIPKISEANANQYLDKLKVEKERGITVKAQTASMYYTHKGEQYLLNLVDTPGHVDFTYEVSRSMRSCKGALLLVDCTQGIQAQTISNFDLAFEAELKMIPVINKVDMPAANPESTVAEIQEQFDAKREEIHLVSAKTGKGVEGLLPDIVEKIPPPDGDITKDFRGFVIDSWFLKDKGVITLVQVVDGYIAKGDKIVSNAFKARYDVFEVGILHPEMKAQDYLTAGQVGFIFMNMKNAGESRVGDTFYKEGTQIEPIQGFKPARQMIYSGIYPEDPNDYAELEKAIQKLVLTDPAVSFARESSAALGNGFRCGFLGLLHMDVFKQRLDDEYNISAMLTLPNVSYRCKLRTGEIVEVENALQAPDPANVSYYEEPMAEATLIIPKASFSEITNLCIDRRGEQLDLKVLDGQKYLLRYLFPMSEVISDFFDKLKSLTKGYGSFDFEFSKFKRADIRKLVILLMGEPVDALSFLIHEDRAQEFGKDLCRKLKEHIPRQQFAVVIQAKLGSRIVAREEVPMMKKNVTAKCYGGDYSRKKKLLERQKEGKKMLRRIGKVEVSKDTFMGLLKKD